MITLCERCAYDEAYDRVSVPDYFKDRYQAICAACADALHAKQAKMEAEGFYEVQ